MNKTILDRLTELEALFIMSDTQWNDLDELSKGLYIVDAEWLYMSPDERINRLREMFGNNIDLHSKSIYMTIKDIPKGARMMLEEARKRVEENA